MLERRNIDESVQNAVARVETRIGKMVPPIGQAAPQILDMRPLKQHGWPMVDRGAVRVQVELGGVDGDAAGNQALGGAGGPGTTAGSGGNGQGGAFYESLNGFTGQVSVMRQVSFCGT